MAIATAYMFTLYTSYVRFLVRAFGAGPGQSRTETVRDRTVNQIMQSSCSLRSLRRKSYGGRTASIRRPRGDGTVTVRSSCTFGHSCTKSVQLHISALCCRLRWHLKQKTGKEKGTRRKISHRKAAARSWCGRSGIAAR